MEQLPLQPDWPTEGTDGCAGAVVEVAALTVEVDGVEPAAGSVSWSGALVGSSLKSTAVGAPPERSASSGWPNGSKRRSSATVPSPRVNSAGPAVTPWWK